MSRSAGTLQTTHQSTYIPPRLMPGYKGHCPTAKFDYGETYGNATAKYFQDYRSQTLNESKSHYAKGGQFPTVYTHNPDLVIHARDRTREQWRTAPKYELTNVNYDRREEINKFDKLAQDHRQYYKDRTGTVPRVDEFLIPKKAEDMYRQDVKSDSAHTESTLLGILEDQRHANKDDRQCKRSIVEQYKQLINKYYNYRKTIAEEEVNIEAEAKLTKMLNQPVIRAPKTSTSSRTSTVRDRAMRDVVFESR